MAQCIVGIGSLLLTMWILGITLRLSRLATSIFEASFPDVWLSFLLTNNTLYKSHVLS